MLTVMDAKFRDILDALPEKLTRSRLEPYRELIGELRRRRRTYLDIAQILAEKCQVQVTASGVHDFVRRRLRTKRTPAVPRSSSGEGKGVGHLKAEVGAVKISANSPSDDVQRKIAALKARKPGVKATKEGFQFDPSEPLRLNKPER